MAFLSEKELKKIGFARIGKNVQLSDKAAIYNPGNIYIGNNTRIDDFCILSAGDGGIHLGDHVHIACYVGMIGAGEIRIGSFSGISAKTIIYSSNDDYTGEFMTGPTIPDEFRKVTTAPVTIGEHAIVGAGCIMLPGTVIQNGVSVGSMSLVRGTLEADMLYAGIPVKKIRAKSTRYKLFDTSKLSASRATQVVERPIGNRHIDAGKL